MYLTLFKPSSSGAGAGEEFQPDKYLTDTDKYYSCHGINTKSIV